MLYQNQHSYRCIEIFASHLSDGSLFIQQFELPNCMVTEAGKLGTRHQDAHVHQGQIGQKPHLHDLFHFEFCQKRVTQLPGTQQQLEPAARGTGNEIRRGVFLYILISVH